MTTMDDDNVDNDDDIDNDDVHFVPRRITRTAGGASMSARVFVCLCIDSRVSKYIVAFLRPIFFSGRSRAKPASGLC